MKKILIITYYWPPSGGGGVQRWLKFSKYLPEYGWEPIIFTPENPDFDIQDPTLLKEVNSELEVIKLPIWEPYKLFEKISGKKRPSQGLIQSKKKTSLFAELAVWIRGNFLIPDPRKFWIKPSVKFLKILIKDNDIDVIVTTGPPQSMHLIGLGLKEKLNIKWIADFRDPWSKWDMLDNFKLSNMARKKHEKLEQKVLKNADEVITVSNVWAEEFNEIYSRDYQVISNGFDEDDFQYIEDKESGEKIVISHFGLINNFRNPEIFWNALKALAIKKEIEVRLYGTIEKEIQDNVLQDSLLKGIVNFRPPVSHEEVIEAYAQSDILLLLLNKSDNAKGHIPGKLFEYLASQRPIIALGPENGDTASIIQDCEAGVVINWEDEARLIREIQALVGDGKPNFNLQKVKQFSRKNLTKKLVDKILSRF